MAGFRIDALADIREIKVFGDWAYRWNHLTVTVTAPDGTAVKRAGDVLSILRKENDRWVIFRDANLLAATKG
jgi:ketosteroid isomerase-like protein